MATITLNEGGLRALLEAPGGPVAQVINRKTEQVREVAARNAERIVPVGGQYVISRTQNISGVPAGVITLDRANIEGSISAYLAGKEAREHVWLAPALEEVFESASEFFA
jgi:hypothetical protein